MLTKIKSTISRSTGTNGRVYFREVWLCRCPACGKKMSLPPHKARKMKSCCITSRTHGLTQPTIHPLYHTYKGIVQRCYNPKSPAFKRYGGRGIKMCRSWKSDVMAFYNWAVGNGWKPGLTVERNDNNKGYNPNNCRFIPRNRQARNRCSNKLTLKEVRKIRSIYNAGKGTVASLAWKYKITPTTMCKIVHNKIWKEDTCLT